MHVGESKGIDEEGEEIKTRATFKYSEKEDRLMNEKDLFGVLYLINSLKKLEGRKRIQKMVCIAKYNPKIDYPFSFNYI